MLWQESRIGKVYTVINLPIISRLITSWYLLLIIIMLFLLTDSPQKLKLEKPHGTLISFFYVSPSSPQLQRFFFFCWKHKKPHSSAIEWWKYTKSCFKKNAKRISKNSLTQKKSTFSRQNLCFLLKTRKNNHSSASVWWENTKSSFKENARKTFHHWRKY